MYQEDVDLIDDSTLSIPTSSYHPIQHPDIENVGVTPSMVVGILPHHSREGRDPQIEAAVNICLEQLHM